MRARRDAAVRLLRTALVASIAVPFAILCWGAWVTYQSTFAHADEQLNATMDVLVEQANTVFESVALTFTGVDTILDGMTDEQIKASEQKLSSQLGEFEKATKAVSAIWIIDKNGHPIVNSQRYPAPYDLDLTDRDYFRAQADHDSGTYIGAVVTPRIANGTVIGVSRRRPSQNGQFAGVIVIAIDPAIFAEFYQRLRRDSGGGYSLAKANGDILARYPTPPGDLRHFDPESGFMRSISAASGRRN